MSRLQLALRVADLDAAVDFYATLFGAAPHKRRDGYANFALDDPPLKLVLFEHEHAVETAATIDHLGIEVETTDEVAAAMARYRDAGLDPDVREQELCCHAVQDKLWVDGADGHRWEVYTVTDDTPDQDAVETASSDCCDGECGCAA